MGQRSYRTVAAVSAIVAGLLAFVINAWLGLALWKGFTFAWFTHEPQAVFDGPVVLGDAFLTALVTAVLTVVITVKAVHHQWTEDDVRYDGEPDDADERRDLSAFTAGALVKYAAFSAIFLSIGVAVVAVGAGSDVPGEHFLYLKIAVGVIAGIYTAWGVTVGLVRGLASGTIVDDPDAPGNVARLSLAGARNPKAVVAVVLVLTLLLGSGLTQITTNVDVSDVLPRGNRHTEAAHNVTDDFKSAFTQQTNVLFSVDPEACRRVAEARLPDSQTDMACDDIRHEVYIRAMDEYFRYIERETPIAYSISVPQFYKLINWTEAGGEDAPDAAFDLPPTDARGELQYRTVEEGVWTAIPDAVNPIISPERKHATSLFMIKSNSTVTQRELGREFIDARDSYLDWVEEEGDYPVFTEDNKPLIFSDRAVANAHSSKLAQEDFAFLFPLILGFVAALLWLAFRNREAILVSGTTLAVGSIWTYGLMGHLGIPLNTLNLAVIPILLGNGIDYAIHMINEVAEHKSELASDEQAFELAGGRAGFAMFIATTTTVAGLLIMMVSPSLLLAQMGLLAAVAMISIFFLAVTFIPAQLTLLGRTEDLGASFEPSELMPKAARFVSNHRIAFGGLVVVLTVLLALNMANLTIEPFGDPSKNWPEDDPLRQEHETALARFYNTPEPSKKANVIVFQGDLHDYDAHVYMEDLYFEMRGREHIDMSTSRHIPFLIDTWLTVKDGPAQAGLRRGLDLGAREADMWRYNTSKPDYPRSPQAIRQTFDDSFASPLATFSSLFSNYPESDIGIMTFSVDSDSYPDAVASWGQINAALEEAEDSKPAHIETAVVGNTATNVLFVQGQLPWLNYMTVGSIIVVATLVAFFTGSIRATVTIASLVGLTAVWTIGVLPLIDVGLAITLMVPLVFITSIGSDYGVHLLWNIDKTGDAWRTMETTGKAVMFSAVTDAGAFIIFSRTQNLAVRDAVLTTALAIGLIFVVTLLVVSLAYNVEETESIDRETVQETVARIEQHDT